MQTPIIVPIIAWLITAAAPAQMVDGPSADTSFSYHGVVMASRQIIIIAPLDGVLVTMPYEEGQEVAAGDVLVQLDDEAQKLVVEGARLRAEDDSQLRQAQLALEDAQLKYDMAEDLQKRGAGSLFEVRRTKLERDLAEAQIDTAKSNRQLAQANLALEQEKLKRYQVKAPFAGTITRIVTEEGATITHNDQLMQLSALDELEAQLYLPISLFGKLASGKIYRLQAAEPVNAEIRGTLKYVDRIIDTASRTFRCTFVIENTDNQLPAGFMARLIWPQE